MRTIFLELLVASVVASDGMGAKLFAGLARGSDARVEREEAL